MGFLGRVGQGLATGGLSEAYRAGTSIMGESNRANNEFRDVDPEGNLGRNAGAAGAFANVGEAGYGDRTAQMQGVADQLGRLSRGEDSFSAMQLKQALGQNLNAQASMAAGARPGNAAMAARTAAMQQGRMGAGLAGQQALAGIAERQSATQSLGNMLGQMRGQDLSAALGSRQNALSGYGTIEGQRGQRFGDMAGIPTEGEQMLGLVQGVGSLAAAKSDERGKTGVSQGGGKAFLDALQDYQYRYRDPSSPGAAPGRQLGVMAQDLERSPMGRRSVADTPAGKMVDTTRLAHALAAGAANLNDRVAKLEDRKRG